jgi:hypothetical protein
MDNVYCQISEKYTIWAQTFARNYVLSAHYIAYIISSKCLGPYGILLADLTIAVEVKKHHYFHLWRLQKSLEA